ncbi:hypothetical protein BZG36_03672 [Bifiguratus adelaidae]|uniref:LysM domain-containing protein n=1 Tax=Bifiguratus adelaidae TaxID=1938954 RepID=A0A261Y017_9FUNG|nr:hypothetical protein BZG36_03672 [Bifiguratus adelaidae]
MGAEGKAAPPRIRTVTTEEPRDDVSLRDPFVEFIGGNTERRPLQRRASVRSEPSDPLIPVIVHRIKPTDTIAGVSLYYGVEITKLKKVNKLWSNDSIHVRKELYIPLECSSLVPSTEEAFESVECSEVSEITFEKQEAFYESEDGSYFDELRSNNTNIISINAIRSAANSSSSLRDGPSSPVDPQTPSANGPRLPENAYTPKHAFSSAAVDLSSSPRSVDSRIDRTYQIASPTPSISLRTRSARAEVIMMPSSKLSYFPPSQKGSILSSCDTANTDPAPSPTRHRSHSSLQSRKPPWTDSARDTNSYGLLGSVIQTCGLPFGPRRRKKDDDDPEPPSPCDPQGSVLLRVMDKDIHKPIQE